MSLINNEVRDVMTATVHELKVKEDIKLLVVIAVLPPFTRGLTDKPSSGKHMCVTSTCSLIRNSFPLT